MQPGQQAYQRYRYAEPAGRLYVRATGNRLLCRYGSGGGYWALFAAYDEHPPLPGYTGGSRERK